MCCQQVPFRSLCKTNHFTPTIEHQKQGCVLPDFAGVCPKHGTVRYARSDPYQTWQHRTWKFNGITRKLAHSDTVIILVFFAEKSSQADTQGCTHTLTHTHTHTHTHTNARTHFSSAQLFAVGLVTCCLFAAAL